MVVVEKSVAYENQDHIQAIIELALREDVGDGDITSICTISEEMRYLGRFVAKADGIIAGLAVVRQVMQTVDHAVRFETLVEDGARIQRGAVVATTEGSGRSLLTAERSALNFLQRMSGIATATNQYVNAVADTNAVILDTRKTAPGQRLTDKMAVMLGGGVNHRVGLFDMVLIKENHIAAAGGITEAVAGVRRCDRQSRAIEVEVRTLDELREAIRLNVDRIMLDNMSLAQMTTAVEIVAGRVKLEASGGVDLDSVRGIAETGVDFISVGALTHSVTAFDVSFLLENVTDL